MEKIRKITGWLLIIYTLLAFLALVVVAKRFSLLSFFAALKSHYLIMSILIVVFLLWLGILFIRKKFNKDRAVIISISLVILIIMVHLSFASRNIITDFIKYPGRFLLALEFNMPKLIGSGFNVNEAMVVPDGESVYPLACAIVDNKYDIVKALIKKGADVNAEAGEGYSILTASVYTSGNVDIIKLLLDSGADVNKIDGAGRAALHYAVVVATNPAITRLLIDYGADVNKLNKEGYTPLYYAAWHGNIDIFNYLIEQGADIKGFNNAGRTILHAASYGKQNIELIKLIAESGVDINAGDKDGMTALLYAAKNSGLEIIRYLIDKGADIKAKDNKGKTFLDYLKENNKISEEDKTEFEKLAGAKNA